MENPQSTTAPKLATPQQAIAKKPEKPEKPKNFPGMLKAYLPEIERALPRHMSGDRMARIALTAFRTTPALAKCNPTSVFAAVIQSSQLGLEVGLMGEAHLVPFKDVCQLIPGYQGLMKLARNSGFIEDIYAHEVRANDEFNLVLGLNRNLTHEPLKKDGFPASDKERGEIVGFYAVAVLKDGSRTFQAMSRAQVEQIRDNSKGYQASKRKDKESIWDTDFTSMGLKTVIRRLCKYLPKSPELATAIALDDAAGKGDQNLTVKDAIEGTWSPVDDDQPEETPEETAAAKVSDRPVSDGAPGFEDAVAAVRNGDIDLARSIAATLDDGQKQQIEVAIQNRDKLKETVDKPAAKGKGKKLFKEE